MEITTQLVQLYLWVCALYDKQPSLKYQRWSNNTKELLFSDQEVITVYLFGHLQGRFQQKAIHQYMRQHWRAWFPHLPSYQAFNHRLNLLEAVWPVLLDTLWRQLGAPPITSGADQLIDSLPIMLAVRGRSCHAKVARDQADKGYCESKDIYYHGVKLHLLGAKQYRALPVPLGLCWTEASRHDLPPLREAVLSPLPGTLFGGPDDPRGAGGAGHAALHPGQERERTNRLPGWAQRLVVALCLGHAATRRVFFQLALGEDRHSERLHRAFE